LKVTLQKAISFFLTGSTSCQDKTDFSQNNLTDEELEEMEMSRTEWDGLNNNSTRFNNPTLSLKADWNTMTGYFRNAELGVFDSLFSGIGSGLSKKMSFPSGFMLAGSVLGLSLLSTLKKLPFLSANFSFSDFGGRLTRALLRIFDSIFSSVGEKGAALNIPSLIAGSAGLASLGRVINDKDNKSVKIPYSTIGGTMGRTAIHHLESMLASKGNQLSNTDESLAAFTATTLATVGTMLPRNIKNKKVPVETVEGLSSLLVPHFLDSLFTNIGKSFSPIINKPQNLIIGILGYFASVPVLSNIKSFWNKKAPVPEIGGKAIRSAFGILDTISFNAGNYVGKTALGIPLSAAFAALTYFSCVSKNTEKLFKNFRIPLNTIGSLFQRLPFDFIYSMISSAGTTISKKIPAPILVLIGPALSFKAGNLFKGINAKYDESKGLMVRNTVHLWETILSSAAYRTGKMICGEAENHDSTGTLLGDRWITDDGQIVMNMALGKQMEDAESKNPVKVLLSTLGGIGFGLGAVTFGKYLLKDNFPSPAGSILPVFKQSQESFRFVRRKNENIAIAS